MLRRIPPDVWANVEEVVVFDDASDDATYERTLAYKQRAGLDRLRIVKMQAVNQKAIDAAAVAAAEAKKEAP